MSLFKTTISDARSGKSNSDFSSRTSDVKDRSKAVGSIMHGLKVPGVNSELSSNAFSNQSFDKLTMGETKAKDNMLAQQCESINNVKNLSNHESVSPAPAPIQHKNINPVFTNTQSEVSKVSEVLDKNEIRHAVPETIQELDNKNQKKNPADFSSSVNTWKKENFIPEIKSKEKDKPLVSVDPVIDNKPSLNNKIIPDYHENSVDSVEREIIKETNDKREVLSSVNCPMDKSSSDTKTRFLEKEIKENQNKPESFVSENILSDANNSQLTDSSMSMTNTQQTVRMPNNNISQQEQNDAPLKKSVDTSQKISEAADKMSNLQEVAKFNENITQKTQVVLQNTMSEVSRKNESNNLLNDSINNLQQVSSIVETEQKKSVDDVSTQEYPETAKAMVLDNLAISRNNIMQPAKESYQTSTSQSTRDTEKTTEVVIGQVDVFIEAPHRSESRALPVSRPSASLSSRHYLRRL